MKARLSVGWVKEYTILISLQKSSKKSKKQKVWPIRTNRLLKMFYFVTHVSMKTVQSFDDRNTLAKSIHFSDQTRRSSYRAWDIVIISLWCNIWSEQDGKKQRWRPCLIISIIWWMAIICPLSTKRKPNTEHINIHCVIDGVESYCLLNQIRSVDIKRIVRNFWRIDESAFRVIKTSLQSVLRI